MRAAESIKVQTIEAKALLPIAAVVEVEEIGWVMNSEAAHRRRATVPAFDVEAVRIAADFASPVTVPNEAAASTTRPRVRSSADENRLALAVPWLHEMAIEQIAQPILAPFVRQDHVERDFEMIYPKAAQSR
jgi:hypothetical protein